MVSCNIHLGGLLSYMLRNACMLLSTTAVACVMSTAALADAETSVAQSWVAPSDSDRTPLGPRQARGAVIWSHGRSLREDSLVPTPPYIAVLRQAGWDTYRFNRMRQGDTLAESSQALVDAVGALKRQGYGRVVLAGQSFGAFLSLMAADASSEVDGVIATAPAAFGNFGGYYDSWRKNASRLYPLLQQLQGHVRILLFFFHGDDFDPGGRGERSHEILAASHVNHLVVDQPAAFTGHVAAATPAFAEHFGRCIADFIAAEPGRPVGSCDQEATIADNGPQFGPRQEIPDSQPGLSQPEPDHGLSNETPYLAMK
jgi:dienelactone hydrolase